MNMWNRGAIRRNLELWNNYHIRHLLTDNFILKMWKNIIFLDSELHRFSGFLIYKRIKYLFFKDLVLKSA